MSWWRLAGSWWCSSRPTTTHATHRLIQELAATEPLRTALYGWNRASPVLPVARYAELLYAAGGQELIVFEKVYPHVLPDAAALINWTRGTTLVPYLERMPEVLQREFLERYSAELQQLFPQAPVFYSFNHILFSASKLS